MYHVAFTGTLQYLIGNSARYIHAALQVCQEEGICLDSTVSCSMKEVSVRIPRVAGLIQNSFGDSADALNLWHHDASRSATRRVIGLCL